MLPRRHVICWHLLFKHCPLCCWLEDCRTNFDFCIVFRSRMDSNRHGDWPLECKVKIISNLSKRFRLNRPGNWFSSSLTFQEILLSKVKNITRCTLETWERTPPGESWRRPSTSLGESGMSGLQRGLQVDRQSSHLRLTPQQALLLSWWTTRGTLRMQPGSLMVPECAGGE